MSTSPISPYVPSSLAEAEALAERLSKSPLMPDGLKNKASDILIIMMTGADLGLAPMAAIRGLFVINGRVGIGAALAVSLVKRHGSCEYFQLVESTDLKATYKTKRRGESETTLTFTIDQARQAGYLNRPPWRATPAQMLRARAARSLAETVFPDALYGMPWDGDEDIYEEPPSHPTVEAAAAAAVTQGTVEVLPPAHSDTPAPPAQATPVNPVDEMLGRIGDASTLARLRSLGAPIREAGLATEPRIRDAYAARQAQIRRAGGVR